jgi:hypothetical protein
MGRNWGPFFGFSNILEKFHSPVLLSLLSFQTLFNKTVKLFEFTIVNGFFHRFCVSYFDFSLTINSMYICIRMIAW